MKKDSPDERVRENCGEGERERTVQTSKDEIK